MVYHCFLHENCQFGAFPPCQPIYQAMPGAKVVRLSGRQKNRKRLFVGFFLSDMDNSKFLEIFSLKRQLQTSTTPLNVLQMSNKCPMENPINVLKKIQVIWSKF
jgi:hypothetical protein